MHTETASHVLARKILGEILDDFGIQTSDHGSSIEFIGELPSRAASNSEHINLSLIGAIPALANSIIATQIYEARGGTPQTIKIDVSKGHNYLDSETGMTTTLNGQEIPMDMLAGNPFINGIYETRDGRHVVPSAVYVELVYQWSTFLGCGVNTDDVAAAIKKWHSEDLEKAAESVGLPFALIQSEETWLSSPQGKHLAGLPIVPWKKMTDTPPKSLSSMPRRPLEGVKVLCATHAIAGPSAGRTLAEHGATVLQIMYTHGFEHPFVYTYANLGSKSSRLNFANESDRQQMWRLISEADVWIDSYRDGALSRFGFTDEEMLKVNDSLIISHVRLYGTSGPWSGKPGFDMQGSASSGMMAHCGGSLATPCWPPGQVINDYTTGYYGALAIQAAILRRMKYGGGYVLSPSLTGTAMSIMKHFKPQRSPRLSHADAEAQPPDTILLKTGLGLLRTLKPLPGLSVTPIQYSPVTLEPMGSCLPVFDSKDTSYDISKASAVPREETVKHLRGGTETKMRKLKKTSRAIARSTL